MWRLSLALGLMIFALPAASGAQDPGPRSIAIFPFELEDRSAGAGVIPPDARDLRYLKESQLMAEKMLAASGRFHIVEADFDSDEKRLAPHGIRNCNGCEAAIAQQHGASLALLGVVTRVNRTEHTMFIRILDAETHETVAQGFTDLRMGANYAWPRSVKWVITNRILK